MGLVASPTLSADVPRGSMLRSPKPHPAAGFAPRSADGGCTASSVGLPVPPATFVCIKWPINNGRVHLLLLEKHFRWMVITGTRILEDHFNCIFPGCVSRATVFPRDVKLRTSVYRDDAWFPSVRFQRRSILASITFLCISSSKINMHVFQGNTIPNASKGTTKFYSVSH